MTLLQSYEECYVVLNPQISAVRFSSTFKPFIARQQIKETEGTLQEQTFENCI